MMNGCFNGKGLTGTELKPAVPDCEVNTYQEAATLCRKMLKLEGCSTWASAEGKGKATSTCTTLSRHNQRFSDG